MLEHVINYQIGFYGPGTHLEPAPDLVSKLLEQFRGKELIPTTATELQVSEDFGTRLQLQFISPNQEWLVAFEAKRILIRKQSVQGGEIGTLDIFRRDAHEILTQILEVTPIVGNRLSLVVKGILPEMPEEELAGVYSKLIKPIDFYKSHRTTQWSTRSIARVEVLIGTKQELLNVITDVNRSQGKLKQDSNVIVDFDRIEVGLDINTHQDNTAQRFTSPDIGVFLTEAISLGEELILQVVDMVHE